MNKLTNHNVQCTNRKLPGWQTMLLVLALLSSSQAFAEQSITFFHNDILGSPVAATDENGNVCWREDYKPYGEKLKNNDSFEPSTVGCGLDDNQIGYTGHVNDKDIGLTYMQARYYDPIIGRFMGVDPVEVRLDNQASFNRYAYGNNNPYRFVDPDGMEADDHHGGDDGDPLGGFGNMQDAHSMHGFDSRNDPDLGIETVSIVDPVKKVKGAILGVSYLKKQVTEIAPKFPKDIVTPGARRLANKSMTETNPKKAKALRELIPKNQKKALAKHFDNVADFNKAKRGTGVQVDLQVGRARFLRGETNTPPGNATNFNPSSLE